MQWVPLDDPELEAEFEVFGIDVTVARALAGRELLGITDTFACLLDATRTELGFSGKTFYLKIETGKDFFEPGRIDADAFGPAAVKRIVGEVHTLLEVVEAAIRIADAAAQKAPDLFPEGFTEHIVENDDGTFSVHGRTYTSRATAEAYLEHYG